ncbi:hypothetical protein BC628DRAFT_1473464 [Trametes gibbosa]|nr:hypothetical protein BC628DRAFT_1473464 [Trametes gibbosa]
MDKTGVPQVLSTAKQEMVVGRREQQELSINLVRALAPCQTNAMVTVRTGESEREPGRGSEERERGSKGTSTGIDSARIQTARSFCVISTPNVSASLLSLVPKLNGDNYYNWKFAITQVLRFTSCLSVVTADKRLTLRDKAAEWDRLSEQGLTVIGLTVEPSQYVYIRDAKTASATWTTLQGQYQKNFVCNSLDWSNITTSLSTSQGELKITDVTSALEDEESRHTLNTANYTSSYSSANAARALSTSTATARGRTPLTHVTCYNCGVKGHYQQQCDKPLKPFRVCAAIAYTQTSVAAADEEWTTSV